MTPYVRPHTFRWRCATCTSSVNFYIIIYICKLHILGEEKSTYIYICRQILGEIRKIYIYIEMCFNRGLGILQIMCIYLQKFSASYFRPLDLVFGNLIGRNELPARKEWRTFLHFFIIYYFWWLFFTFDEKNLSIFSI